MLQLTQRDIDLFAALNRHRYLRSNFMYQLLGGSTLYARDRIGFMFDEGYLKKPKSQNKRLQPLNHHRIYELTDKSKAVLRKAGISVHSWNGQDESAELTGEFWHRVMIADIVASFELIANKNGIRFRDQWDILSSKSFAIPANISWGKHTWKKEFEPDALFALNDTYFLLEADRGTEPLTRDGLNLSSYLRKLLCYRDIIVNRTVQHHWGITSPMVLNITLSPVRSQNIIRLFKDVGSVFNPNPKSFGMLFMGEPSLAMEGRPKPLLDLLDRPIERVGYPALKLESEVMKSGYPGDKKVA